MTSRIFTFIGSHIGEWRVVQSGAVIGEPLPQAPRVEIVNAYVSTMPTDASWMLRGTTSNERYVTREERERLVAKQPVLGRSKTTCAALIPLRKSESWWGLTQDERREIFEARSQHITVGLQYLPAVARRLHHSRDLGEPFDFITWFEYAPEDAAAFEQLLERLRATEEWKYVDRESDIRLVRDPDG